jgi:hypothetical protein
VFGLSGMAVLLAFWLWILVRNGETPPVALVNARARGANKLDYLIQDRQGLALAGEIPTGLQAGLDEHRRHRGPR